MKNKFAWTALGLLAFVIGCASVEVKAPKDPIKMDIAMRLDVYQHVAKDIDDIENIVEGRSAKPATKLSSIGNLFVREAYADAGGLSPEATDAAYRRRDRRAELLSLEDQGALSENASGLITELLSGNARAHQVMTEENNDRMIIYRAIAQKNGSSVEDVKKVYAERLQGNRS